MDIIMEEKTKKTGAEWLDFINTNKSSTWNTLLDDVDWQAVEPEMKWPKRTKEDASLLAKENECLIDTLIQNYGVESDDGSTDIVISGLNFTDPKWKIRNIIVRNITVKNDIKFQNIISTHGNIMHKNELAYSDIGIKNIVSDHIYLRELYPMFDVITDRDFSDPEEYEKDSYLGNSHSFHFTPSRHMTKSQIEKMLGYKIVIEPEEGEKK